MPHCEVCYRSLGLLDRLYCRFRRDEVAYPVTTLAGEQRKVRSRWLCIECEVRLAEELGAEPVPVSREESRGGKLLNRLRRGRHDATRTK